MNLPTPSSSIYSYSPQILETLRNIIAPGKRIKLSPYIESAQVKCLFNEILDPKSRNQHIHQIIKNHGDFLDILAREHSGFTTGEKKFTGSYDKNFLDRYMIYYFPVNVAKLQLMLLETLEQEEIAADINIIDIGVGSGTSVLALFDFFLAWETVCQLYGVKFPIQSINYYGYDNSQQCLNYAQQAVNAYQGALQERLIAKDISFIPSFLTMMDKCEWHINDINSNAPPNPLVKNQSLLVSSNVLNELKPSGVKNIENIFCSLPQSSLGFFIEPGDKYKTYKLNKWRKDLCSTHSHIQTVSPCGQENETFIATHCESCWNARRESLYQSSLYKIFKEKCNHYKKDERTRSFDEFQNDLLSWSYYVLKVSSANASSYVPPFEDSSIKRYLGKYSFNQILISNANEEKAYNVVENLKFCPGVSSKYKEIKVIRPEGVTINDLRYGTPIRLTSLRSSKYDQNNNILSITPDTESLSKINSVEQNKGKSTFLSSYNHSAQEAVDEIAYRLFGFPGMRPFQHTILSRALTGKNILGIAATGGGKSECYILPAVLMPGITIVIAPLISLIQDQYDQRIKERYGLEGITTFINSDVDFRERQARLKRLTMGYYKIVYLTPEQLEKSLILTHLKEAHSKYGIRYLALDECHCISQWGHDFRPAYLNMVSRLNLWKIVPTRIALTATASPEVRSDLCSELTLIPEPLESGGDVYIHSSNRHELNFVAKVFLDMESKAEAMVEEVRQLILENKRNKKHPGAAILFFPYTGGNPESTNRYLPDTKQEKDFNKLSPIFPQVDSNKGMLSAGVTPFASFLERQLNQKVSIYHGKIEKENKISLEEYQKIELGNLKGRSRSGQQKAFVDGYNDIMVATKGFGMGIDKPNIRLVIHRTPTSNLEAYAQEAGRAGRDGEIANCLLFYSPDKNTKAKIPSDHEIQQQFLSEKYIRREDIIVLFHALKSLKRGSAGYLYFTNDEMIAFYDKCTQSPESIGLPSFDWPKFPDREPEQYEKDDEKSILNRGDLYNNKTSYINRILSVAYKVRPYVDGHYQTILEELQETGAALIWGKPQVFNAKAIINSNHYFGEFFRNKGFAPEKLETWLYKRIKGDIIEFAQELDISIKELSGLLQDIKRADGNFRNGKWQPSLLNIDIITPKYGPAEGKNYLAAWRNYAGAITRNKKAYIDAKKKNRKATIDEIFGWKQLPSSKGWEIKLGSIFQNQEDYELYLDKFMQVHNDRRDNDWAAYHRLLTDYIGVEKDGSVKPGKERLCLRSVMLGYLKTYEVVEGGSCLSCNVCVPNEKFEIDIEKRKKVVVKLNTEIATFLDSYEKEFEILPSIKKLQLFWTSVEAETKAGRSAQGYVEGVTGRMLDDNPSHLVALYIRITGIVFGFMNKNLDSFAQLSNTFSQNCNTSDLKEFLINFTTWTNELFPNEPKLYTIQANILNKLEKYKEEFAIRNKIEQNMTTSSSLRLENAKALCLLTKEEGPLADATNYLKFLHIQSHHEGDTTRLQTVYNNLFEIWDWDSVADEIAWYIDSKTRDSQLTLFLTSYLTQKYKSFQKDSFLQLLNSHIPSLPKAIWEIPALSSLSYENIKKYQELKQSFWENIPSLKKLSPTTSFHLFLEKIRECDNISEKHLECINSLLFKKKNSYKTIIKELPKDINIGKIIIDTIPISLVPANQESFTRWLALCRLSLSSNDFPHTFEVIKKLFTIPKSDFNAIISENKHFLCSILTPLLSDIQYMHDTINLVSPYIKEKEIFTLYTECLEKIDHIDQRLINILSHSFVHGANNHRLNVIENVSPLLKKQTHLDKAEIVILINLHKTLSLLKETCGINLAEKLEVRHLNSIHTIFPPDISTINAFCMACIIGAIRPYLVQTWLTPVAYLIEASCLSGQFEKAGELINQFPEISVTKKRSPAITFLEATKGQEHLEPINPDCAHLIEVMIENEVSQWKITRTLKKRIF